VTAFVVDGVQQISDVLAGRARWAIVEGRWQDYSQEIPDGAAGSVITDPPYEAEAHTMQRRVKRGPRAPRTFARNSAYADEDTTQTEPIPFPPITPEEREAAAREAVRLAARWQVVFCQVEAAVVWRDALERGGAVRRRIGAWFKPDAQPQLTGDRAAQGYECYVTTHRPGKSRWNGRGKSSAMVIDESDPWSYPPSAIELNKNDPDYREGAPHPTTKPLALMRRLVELYTDPDELVVDFYAGSFSTGHACLALGRRFIGFEVNPEHAAKGRRRLEAAAVGVTLKEHTAGQTALF
jgi:DNA modification methylase